MAQYDAAVPRLPPAPSVAREPMALAVQRTDWHQTMAAISAVLPSLTLSDLTSNTVWKHPALGPVTGLEILFFPYTTLTGTWLR